MNAPRRLSLVVTFWAVVLAIVCYREYRKVTFTEAVRRAERVAFYEGLPHQVSESRLLEEERRTKSVQELNGYPFYQEPLTLSADDSNRVLEVLGEAATYEEFQSAKLCGEFHPDYAVELHVAKERYRALICFGCREIRLFGPGLKLQKDLERAASEKLQKLLKNYKKNRPAMKLSEVVPAVSISLRPTDHDVLLDLPPLIDQTNENGLYAEDIDYSEPLLPPLSSDQSEWAATLLAAQPKVVAQ